MAISVLGGGLAVALLILAMVLGRGIQPRPRRAGSYDSSIAWMSDGGGDSGCDSGSAGDGSCGGGDGGGGGGGD